QQAMIASPQAQVNWHARLCHVNNEKIKQMKQKFGQLCTNNTECKHCIIGKMTKRIPKPPSTLINTSKPLELVHCDLCGDFVESSGGKNCMLTLVYDYSRYSFVYFIARKSEVASSMTAFINFASNQTGHELKRIRTDNGLEFCNKIMSNICDQFGLVHERTAV